MCCRYQVKVQLAERMASEIASHRGRVISLGKRWRDVQFGKRVIIHLPSLGNTILFIVTVTSDCIACVGHPLCVRGTETQLNMEQSLQLARIADIQGIYMYTATSSPYNDMSPAIQTLMWR